MTIATRLNEYLPDLFATVKRFPIAVAAALGVFILLNFFIIGHERDGQTFSGLYYELVAGIAAFFGAGIGHLIGEGRKQNSIVVALIMAAVVFALMYFFKFFHTSELFLFAGLLPLLMIAPYLRRDVNQGAVWLFNLRLALAFVLAAIVGVIFALEKMSRSDDAYSMEINPKLSLLVRQASGTAGSNPVLEAVSFWVVLHE